MYSAEAGRTRRNRLIAGVVGLVALAFLRPAYADSMANCDRLAASSYDEQSIGEPVTWLVLRRSAERAIDECRKAVDADGDTPRFKYQLARALDAASRYDEAAAIYQDLADVPYAAAIAELGVLYSTGKGVEKDAEKAYALSDRAAAMGNLRGLTIAGVFQTFGTGVEKNVEKGRERLKQAADRGFSEAMEYLGDIYLQGLGVEADPVAALQWYEKAAEKGRIRSALAAGQLAYGNTETHERAYYWFSIAARAGNVPAMKFLAKMAAAGEATEKNEEEAVAWMLKVADAGDSTAYFALGRIYETGTDVERNPERAKHWYQEGVKANNAASAYRLARGYDKGEYGDNPELVIDYLIFASLSGFKPAQEALLSGLPIGRWTASSRIGLQEKLKAEGYYSGPIDGLSGPETLNAVPRLLRP